MSPQRNLDRARIYRTLARLFRRPEPELLEAMRCEDLAELEGALGRLGATGGVIDRARTLRGVLDTIDAETLAQEWDRNFEPSGGLACSPNETTHTAKTSQEAWLKTYRLADIAGFYRAFGVEVQPGSEKVDHVGVEVEFMHLLATKAAAAQERDLDDQAQICNEAAASFLADHLGRWCGDLVSCLREAAVADTYVGVAELLRDFVALDIGMVGPPPAASYPDHRARVNPSVAPAP